MDKRMADCPGLTEADFERLDQVEAGLPITADVSRSDVLLCCLQAEERALVIRHVIPKSISSLYRKDVTGRTFSPEEQPLIFRALKSGNSGRHQKEILSSGAPVIQDVYPIYSADGSRIIGAALFEANMIAHERQRRRDHRFRQAVHWLQEMCLDGRLTQLANFSRFGLYDGIYLVGRDQRLLYSSGIASNLFRSIRIFTDVRKQRVSSLEPLDAEMVDEAFRTLMPLEIRHESEDGRIWVRKAIPLQVPTTTWQNYWQNLPWTGAGADNGNREVEAVLVLLHNATEAVQKQRELNVKSAIIQEVHHRVKNNLQTIAAILRLQARRAESDETKHQLAEAVNRVLSMSVIHEFLSQDEGQLINVREVCQRIAAQVRDVSIGPDQRCEIHVEGPNIRLPASQATPTAMVINELLLNAVEHGLSQRMQGTIRVVLSDLGNAVRLVVEDDGTGLPPDFDPTQSQSLGLQIVTTLVTDDLKGELNMESLEPAMMPTNMGVAMVEDESGAEFRNWRTRVIVTFPKRSLVVQQESG